MSLILGWRQGGWGNTNVPWHQPEYSIDLRMWSDSCTPLDLEEQPGGYRVWKNKAKAYLLGKCPAVGRALGWTGRRAEPIGPAHLPEAAQLIPGLDVDQVNGLLCAPTQRTAGDRLRRTTPELAGG